MSGSGDQLQCQTCSQQYNSLIQLPLHSSTVSLTQQALSLLTHTLLNPTPPLSNTPSSNIQPSSTSANMSNKKLILAGNLNLANLPKFFANIKKFNRKNYKIWCLQITNTLVATGLTVHLIDKPDPTKDKEINCANIVYTNIMMTINNQTLLTVANHTTVPKL